MADLSTCPSRDDLQRMLLGKLPAADAEEIESHLNRCPTCSSVLQQCVASDEFLEAVRASRGGAREPTKTMELPFGWIQGAMSTWVRSHDSTQPEKHLSPLSMVDVKSLLSPAQAADEIGRLADFRVLRVLGVGGMAVVFEAEDRRLKRRVALKLMHPLVAAKSGATERFLREAQSAASLKHEHVVTIYQVGMHGETPFIALELLHGETLEDCLVRNGRLSVREVVRIGREIAMGLAVAHARGLLHRDIKPANIWLEGPETPVGELPAPHDSQGSGSATAPVESVHFTNGRRLTGKVKILDFGLAKVWTDESGISYPGLLIGTPAYMAPEQLAGTAVDPRTDLFSLGCLLYRMASGNPPFGGGNLLSVVRALAIEEPLPVQAVNRQVPPALSDLIGQLLSKSPEQRPPSAQAVVDRLRAMELELPAQKIVEQPNTDGLSKGSGARRGQQTKWGIGAVVGLIVLLPLVYLLFGAQIFRIATNKGQVVIEVDDPTVEVTVKEHQIVILDRQGQAEITLATGEHELEVTVKQPAGETTFQTDRFTLSRGGRKVIDVREELKKAVALQTPAVPKLPKSRTTGAMTKDEIPAAAAVPNRDRRAALWVLSRGGTVTVYLDHSAVPIEVQPGHALPATDFRLANVLLQNGSLTDAELEHLRGLKHLVVLVLSGKQITGAGFDNLEGLTELKTLVLTNTSVTDDGLKHVQGLTKLASLSLDHTQLTDAGLVHLKTLKKLRSLVLDWTQVTDAGLVQLEALPQLQGLGLCVTRATDAGLVHLRGLTKLRILNLGWLPVTDAGLVHVEALTNLQLLVLDRTRVTGAGLAHLQGLTKIRRLDLKGATQVDDSVVPQLLNLRSLVDIDLSETGVSATGFAALKAGLPGSVHVVWSDPNITAAKAVLAAGGSLDVRLEGAHTDRSVKAIGELPSEPFQITAVSMAGARPPLAAVFAALKKPGVHGLVSLDLSGAAIRDADLPRLKRLTHLRRLVLEGTAVHGPGLVQLLGLTNLEELVLSGTETTDEGLAPLRRLTGLTSLVLDRTRVTDLGLAHLADLTALKTLSLRNTAVKDAGLQHLAGLTNLKSLVLDGTRVSDAGLAHVRRLAALTTLNLTNTRVTDAGLRQIQGLTNLEFLWLAGTPVTDAGLMHLKALKNLHVLSLNSTRVTDAGLVQLEGLPQLEVLGLRSTRVTDAGLVHLRGITKLRSLDLSSLSVTDAGLEEVQVLKQLQHLNLDRTRVRDAGLAHLKELGQLNRLGLGETQVTDAGLSELQGLKNLRDLGLKGLSRLSDAAIPKLLGLRSLQYIDLRDAHVSAKGLTVLKGFSPNLRVEWSEPNYSAASAVLAAGGHVAVLVEGATAERPVKAIGELPAESFQITRVRLAGSRRTLDELLPAIANPRLEALVSLDLSGTVIDDADVERLKSLVWLQELMLAETRTTDAGLAHLKGLTALRRLVLNGDAIRGPGLTYLQKLPELTELRLDCPALTELFLVELAGLKKLERLSLAKSPVSDAGVKYLAQFTHLRELDLSDTNVTAARIEELKKSLPQCRIIKTSLARQLAKP